MPDELVREVSRRTGKRRPQALERQGVAAGRPGRRLRHDRQHRDRRDLAPPAADRGHPRGERRRAAQALRVDAHVLQGAPRRRLERLRHRGGRRRPQARLRALLRLRRGRLRPDAGRDAPLPARQAGARRCSPWPTPGTPGPSRSSSSPEPAGSRRTRADRAPSSSSISSRRSYMSMCPAPAYSFKLACSKLAASLRAKRGGVRWSLVPTATATGTLDVVEGRALLEAEHLADELAEHLRARPPAASAASRPPPPGGPGARSRGARRGSRCRPLAKRPPRAPDADTGAGDTARPHRRAGSSSAPARRGRRSWQRGRARRSACPTARGAAAPGAGRPCPPSSVRRRTARSRSSAGEHLGDVVGHGRDGHVLATRRSSARGPQVEGDHAVGVGEVAQLVAPHLRREVGPVQQQDRRAVAPLDQVRLAPVAHGEHAVGDVVGHGQLRVLGTRPSAGSALCTRARRRRRARRR